MTDLERRLPDAFAGLAEQAPHRTDLALAVRRRARRDAGAVLAAAAVLGVVAVGSGLVVASRQGGTAVPAAPFACPPPQTGVLPEWARAGFHGSDPVATFARSADGDLVAILFRRPLTSPPPSDGANKVLWVSRVPVGPGGVVARARLDGTGPRVPVGVPPELGPSSVDLPSPGCWRIEVTWAGSTRTVDLEVAAGDPAAHPPPDAVQREVRAVAAGPGARPDPEVSWVLTSSAAGPAVYVVQLTGRFEADGEPPAGALLLEVPDPDGPLSAVVVRRLPGPVDLAARGTVHRYTPFP